MSRKVLISRLLLCLTVFLFWVGEGQAQTDSIPDGFELLPDSSNFVTVSLLVASPGEEGYSALGHCAIRLECPVHGLDYCFTFESLNESPLFNYLTYFMGRMPSAFIVRSTEAYLKQFKEVGRGMVQYPLNLSLHEEQELWRYLDTDWMQGAYRSFDFVKNNCTSVCVMAIEEVMWKVDGERIDVSEWPYQMMWKNGEGIMYLTRNTPWLQLGLMALVGSEADTFWQQENRLSPELIGQVLKKATVMDAEGTVRPILNGEPQQLLPLVFTPTAANVKPLIAFAVLLVVVCLITLAERLLQWHVPARILDTFLLSSQTLLGLFLLYLTLVSCIFGLHWNWLLLIFNPIPFLLWLLFRKRKGYNSTYWVYLAVLLVVVVAGPFISSQFIWPYRLIAAVFAVRCAAHVCPKL